MATSRLKLIPGNGGADGPRWYGSYHDVVVAYGRREISAFAAAQMTTNAKSPMALATGIAIIVANWPRLTAKPEAQHHGRV